MTPALLQVALDEPRLGAARSFFVFAKANPRRPIVQTYEDLHRCRLDVAMAMEREVQAVRT